MQPNETRTIANTHNFFFPFDAKHPIYVLDVGWHETPPRHTYGPAVRPYYLLHLIESGKGELERAGKTTKLSAGEAFWIFPEEVTTYRADAQDPWTYGWISFSGDFAPEIVRATTDRFFAPYRQSGIRALKSALESRNNDPVSALNTLFRVLNAVKTDVFTDERDAVDFALQRLENNYFHELDVTALAAEFGYSRAHFTTLFTKKTGESPYRYLTRIRIEKAKTLLCETDLSVEEIAFSVGFFSAVRFCDLFKKRVGCTPSEFRRLL